MALSPGPDLGAVGEQEDQAEGRHGEKEEQRRELLEARPETVEQRANALGCGRVGVLRRVLCVVPFNAQVLQPALDRVLGLVQVGTQITALTRDAGKHDEHDQCAEQDGRDEQQDRARPPGHPLTLEPANQRSGDRRDHPGGNHGEHDRVREREQPDSADQEQGDADQQPRREPDIAQPTRSGKDARQLRNVDLDVVVLGTARLCVTLPASKPTAHHVR